MKKRDLALTSELIDFIAKSPIAYQVIENAAALLESDGYRAFDLQNGTLESGQKYYVTRNGSSLLAFRLPTENPNGFMITASHSDSPAFKLKTAYAVKACDRYLKLDTESYGGGIFSSWFDRPLSVAGRVVIRENDSFRVRSFAIDRDLCMIPNTCIHFNREINTGYKYNASVDTLPLLGAWSERPVMEELIAKELKIKPASIVSYDLFLVNRMRGTIYGVENEFFAAPRIDDQQCAFATLRAFLDSKTVSSVPVLAIFDNEEVGSSTKQGAASDLLRDTLDRIAAHYGTCVSALLPSSMMLSCDNAHAMHPNHPELSDAKNAPHMNEGIVIKHNANQKYTTDAVSEALFCAICKKANVPVQHFSNRSDIAGGSTLGNIASARVSLNTIDIGLAQLAMHSSYETAGTKDTAYMVDACKVFFETSLRCEADGSYCLI